MKTVKNVYDLIGNTPMLEAVRTKEKYGLGSNIYCKLEYFNPAGSIKDRAAMNMIEDAEERGLLKEGSTIIEPTSGNTGIGLAAIAAARGYKSVFVMPDTMSLERRKLLSAYGAEIVLTPGSEGMAGSIKKAEELKASDSTAFIPGQFDNPANYEAHMKSTGPEIWGQMDGKIDYLVATFGTGGTVTGIGKYLKSKDKNIKVVGVEPASSPLLTEGRTGAHKIQGIGANFVPSILDRDIMDSVMAVSDEDALKYGREFARNEGILVGISSGAALAAATAIAAKPENSGENIVVILPDTGERYLSSELYI